MLNTRNEWDPLESIMVGSATHANWPTSDPVFAQESEKTSWKETPVPSGPVPDWIIDQANRELDHLAEILVRFGVKVYRPRPMDFVKFQGMYNYCPRDRLLIWGDTVVDGAMMYPCRDQEIVNYTSVLEQARNIFSMPRNAGLVLDAANICRVNDSWVFLESVSGNRAAYEWLCDKFPQVNIELCNFYAGVHIDSTIVPVREGLVLLNASRVSPDNCPKVFEDWEKVWVSDDMIASQDFYQYPYASKWIGMNMLTVDPETVICDVAQTRLQEVLRKRGINVVPMELSHARTLGGGFHCVTLDMNRRHA
jgi:scyllo-inosamine-4-phosphate amidinotransferase 1